MLCSSSSLQLRAASQPLERLCQIVGHGTAQAVLCGHEGRTDKSRAPAQNQASLT